MRRSRTGLPRGVAQPRLAARDATAEAVAGIVQRPGRAVLTMLGSPEELGRPVGPETVNGIATTKYEIDRQIPDGHVAGAVWLSREGIPMRCEGSYTNKKGKVQTVHWELRHVEIGAQDPSLFEVPSGYSKLPPEAVAKYELTMKTLFVAVVLALVFCENEPPPTKLTMFDCRPPAVR